MAPGPLRFDPIDEAKRHWAARDGDEAAEGMAVVTSVIRVQQIFMTRSEDVLRRFGLTFARYEVLMLLAFSREGRLPLGKIGERLQVHAASVTNAIDRLEGQHFVERVPNPRDGRGTLAQITDAGRAVAQQATTAINTEVFLEMGLSDRDLADLYRVLRKIRHEAGDFT